MSKDSAKREFLLVYVDKTGNPWQRHGAFVKQPGKFYPLDIDYGGPEDTASLQVEAGTRSRLSSAVQELIKLIFDVESMKRAMLEFEVMKSLYVQAIEHHNGELVIILAYQNLMCVIPAL